MREGLRVTVRACVREVRVRVGGREVSGREPDNQIVCARVCVRACVREYVRA